MPTLALQPELNEQLIAIGGILGDAFGVVEAPRVKEKGNEGSQAIHAPVSYTHLTLPTNSRV